MTVDDELLEPLDFIVISEEKATSDRSVEARPSTCLVVEEM
jgi:hypothetical protein